MTLAWRNVIAMLVNPELRRAYAEVVLAEAVAKPLTDVQRGKALAKLERAGFIARSDDGTLTAPSESLTALLAEAPVRPVREGPQRFLTAEGQIDRYPANGEERRVFLAWIANETFTEGEILTEPAVNERLSVYGPDVAVLRRSLVDHGLLERTRSGSSYALAAQPGASAASEAPAASAPSTESDRHAEL
ncbi:hypothetical protein GCM10022381_05530 [Leifsonia kafniensis]|uniref:DUF2087 domain-containing protein n=1 Tax=Leifsonia kafniensis TaxID=475957 RepID=A0ABP7K666_9MICO